MQKNSKLFLAILFIGLGLGLSFYRHTHNLGMPHTHNPEVFLKNVEHDPQRGEKIYRQFCATCHAPDPQITTGAPRKGNSKEWAGYLKNGHEVMVQRLYDGEGSMPPRGGCFECTDEELDAALTFMLK
jgi:cytochrome c5